MKAVAHEIKAATLSELPLASMKAVLLGANEVLLVRNSARVVTAMLDRCSHADVRLSEGLLESETKSSGEVVASVECVAHGAKFDVTSGKALCMPAVVAVKTFPVRVEGKEIFVTIA